MKCGRLALCVLVSCGLSLTGTAQEERAIPVVTTAVPIEKVRFAAGPSAVQMRIEVRSPGGALVYDSGWKDGNILDWLPMDSSGQPLAYGAHRLVMKSRNLAGQTSEKEVTLRVNSDGLAVDDQPGASPKITLTAHDGETGQLITTNGDLSFRFGDFLNRHDTEVMRLTRQGNLGIGTDKPQAPLDVNGLIRTSKGILFPDGTILTTAAGIVTHGDGDGGDAHGQSTPNTPNRVRVTRPPILPLTPPSVTQARPAPRPDFTAAWQFTIHPTGVKVGVTDPAFRLDVLGVISTQTEYDIGGSRFAHNFGTQNTFLGASAGNLTMSGTGNTGIGYNALKLDGTGSDNAAIGGWALYNNGTGYKNAASGEFALYNNTSGYENTASGYGALFSSTIGWSNTAFGKSALFNNTGYYNTAVGWEALHDSTGDQNTAIGSDALWKNTSGGKNVATGKSALGQNTTGYSNIAVGDLAGYNLTTGNDNIDIGNPGVADEGGTIRIGSSKQTKTFIAGITGVTTAAAAVPVLVDANGQLGTASSSRRYKFDIAGMGDATEDLMRLRPVTFRYLAHGNNALLQYGLIAEEVADVYPELVTRNKDGEVETVMYQFLAPMLLNEVQKQHRQIEEQQSANKTLAQHTMDMKAENADLRHQLERLMQRVDQLERKHAAME